MMRAAQLPRDQWARLAGTPLAPYAIALPPDTRILVVEDGAGAIVGQWAAIRYLHGEGLWIADAHRTRGAVLGRLLGEMRRLAHGDGVDVLMTGAVDNQVRGLIAHAGGRALPGEQYVVPVRGLPCR